MTLPHEHAMNGSTADNTIPEGYLPLLFTATYFDMDLVGRNLQMNGVDAVWHYPDLNELPADRPSLYVRADHMEHAVSVISSLDLTDFIIYHGK
jgi:hypothetical protein